MKDNTKYLEFAHEEIFENFSNNLDIDEYDENTLNFFLEQLLLIRHIEKKLALEKKAGVIKGPVHLAAGQEAIAVGISKELRKTDRIFGTHRSHPHILALGSDIVKFFAEILGRSSGLSKGMGGSMHLIDQNNGFMGSVPIVAGTVPIALGAAIAEKIKNTSNISVAYFGDGAIEEGVIFESLNFAKITNAPMLFVVENNLYASHMYIGERQPNILTSRIAEANDIQYSVVDGNDVISVNRISSEYVLKCRNLEGPALLEFITYRHYGHVDWREDIDVGVTRSIEEIERWKEIDPILRLYNSMLKKSLITKMQFEDLNQNIKEMINEKWNMALTSNPPEKAELLSYVYYS